MPELLLRDMSMSISDPRLMRIRSKKGQEQEGRTQPSPTFGVVKMWVFSSLMTAWQAVLAAKLLHTKANSKENTKQLALHTSANSMENAKQLSLPNVSEDFMRSADVVLLLDDGVAILCHSQILSLHSTVIRDMLANLPAGQHDDLINIPLADFTEAQCSALLSYLYSNGVSSEPAAFAKHFKAASVVARFAHIYDVPHALRQVQAYLTDFMDRKYRFKPCDGTTEKGKGSDFALRDTAVKTIVEWALMADRYDMHELRGQCEQVIMMHWECFQDKPDLVDQLSRGALQRIAKGLNTTLLASEWQAKKRKYAPAHDFIAWRQTEAAGGAPQQNTSPANVQGAQ